MLENAPSVEAVSDIVEKLNAYILESQRFGELFVNRSSPVTGPSLNVRIGAQTKVSEGSGGMQMSRDVDINVVTSFKEEEKIDIELLNAEYEIQQSLAPLCFQSHGYNLVYVGSSAPDTLANTSGLITSLTLNYEIKYHVKVD